MKKLLLLIFVFSFAGAQDYSLHFDGVDDWVSIGNSTLIESNQLTVSIAFNSSDIDNGYIVSSGNTNPYSILIDNQLIRCEINSVGIGGVSSYSNNTINNGDWYFVSLVYDGNSNQLFVNGELNDSIPLIADALHTDQQTHLSFGGYTLNGDLYWDGIFKFLGKLDFVQIWDRVLSQPEIQSYMSLPPIGNEEGLVGFWNFNEGSGNTLTDLSGNGNHGTINGATWVENIYGCTDSYACNYDEAANWDDGSCDYPDACNVCFGDNSTCPTITDIDGNVYATVEIGSQNWMKQNLKVTHYNDGSEIQTGLDNSAWSSTEEGAYAVYDDDIANVEVYGNLYNWYSVDDDRGVCPEGWHVPSDDNWKELEISLGMCTGTTDNVCVDNVGGCCLDDWNWRGTNEGSKLAGNFNLWNDGILRNNEEFSTLGFSAIPGGTRSPDGIYGIMNNSAVLWTNTTVGSGIYHREISYSHTTVGRYEKHKNYGFSIRCLETIEGCTDSYSSDYNPEANWNDGSCTYPDNGDYSLSFDGVDDWVINLTEVNNLDVSQENQLTISVDVFLNEMPTSQQRIFSYYPEGLTTYMMDCNYQNDVPVQQYALTLNPEGGIYFLAGACSINQNQFEQGQANDVITDMTTDIWYHITLTFEGEAVRIFLDGELIFEHFVQGEFEPFGGGMYLIGKDISLGNYFRGKLDNLSIWNRELNITEINNLSENFVDYNDSNLLAHYKFNAGSGNTLYDHSGNGNHGTIYGATWAGCTDPLADNYLPDAEVDDGSCTGSPVNAEDFTYAGELDGHYYYLSNYTATWDDAKIVCENNGGYLATISDQYENNYVAQFYNERFFFGYYQLENSSDITGGWLWVNEEPNSYVNWHVDEPNDGGVNSPENNLENCAEMIEDDTWNDVPCMSIHPFIIELETTGCTDETACNYNESALEDDGSCEYPEDDNYNCDGSCGGVNNAEEDCSGECAGQSICGCTDTYAGNYDETSTFDDGSCTDYPDNGDYVLEFDGVDDFVEIEPNDTYQPLNSLSLSSRVYFSEYPEAGDKFQIIDVSNYDPDRGYFLAVNESGNVVFRIAELNLEDYIISDILLIPDNWYNITATYNGTHLSIYVDGQLTGQKSTYIESIFYDGGSLRIGYHSNTYDYFYGFIDDAIIWDRVLTDQEIQTYTNSNPEFEEALVCYYKFNAGEGNTLYDRSGNANHGTINGATWFGAKPEIISIEDVPDDQGGKLYLSFKRSYWDTEGLRNTEFYTVEFNAGNGWIGGINQSAYSEDSYAVMMNTPVDYNENLEPIEYTLDFRVIASMEEGNFVSETAQGYSVDNIVPTLPSGFTAESGDNTGNVALTWSVNTDEDFAYFEIARNDATLIQTTEINYNDESLTCGLEYTYYLSAYDIHGNSSSVSHDPFQLGTYGDLNSDGLINITDLVIFVNHVIDITPINECELDLADYNQDGDANISDIVSMVNLILDFTAPADNVDEEKAVK